MTDKVAVFTPEAPAPAHTFSQGVRKGPFVQVSGQGPVDPATNEYLHPGDVAAQTTRTLQNVKAIVDASGATFDDVVMLRVYLTKREDFAADERCVRRLRRGQHQRHSAAMSHNSFHWPATRRDACGDRRHRGRLASVVANPGSGCDLDHS